MHGVMPMSKLKFGGKWLDDLNQELRGSDRACAVLAGAILDERLKTLISTYLLPAKNKKQDKLLGRSSPLESFSSRIELARRLNLISEEKRKALDWVRDIRNDAAHVPDFAIDNDSYRDKIENLIKELNIKEKAPDLLVEPYNGVKGNFVAVIIMLTISLEIEIKETNQTKHEPTNAISNFTFKDS